MADLIRSSQQNISPIKVLPRIHEEDRNPNGHTYRESSVHVKTVVKDVSRHRPNQSFIYDRVPEDRIN